MSVVFLKCFKTNLV